MSTPTLPNPQPAPQEVLQRHELKAEAIRAGIFDLDGLQLVDLGMLKVNDRGELEGVADAIAKLKRDKPYFFNKSAAEMTDAEFDEALRNHAWRPGSTPPKPRPAGHVSTMTDKEFEQAMRNHAWRTHR